MADELIALKITLPDHMADIHDGLGGVHRNGAIVCLPAPIADAFLAKKLAMPADGSMVAQAQKQAEERRAEAIHAEQKARSAAAMNLHDNLPPEVRQAAAEHGDEVVQEYLANQAQLAEEFEQAMQPAKLNRKQRRAMRVVPSTPEGGDSE